MTTAETFLWYQASPRLQLGLAHLWKQNAFRILGSYQLSPETKTLPGLNLSVGVQGIGTGNPGYAATLEKNWLLGKGSLNGFVGIGLRSNESHGHLVGGFKWSNASGLSFGLQQDGHNTHPFVTYGKGQWVAGFYLIETKNPAWMIGFRF